MCVHVRACAHREYTPARNYVCVCMCVHARVYMCVYTHLRETIPYDGDRHRREDDAGKDAEGRDDSPPVTNWIYITITHRLPKGRGGVRLDVS